MNNCDSKATPDTIEPEFVGLMRNVTAPAGRTVHLTCSVKNLGPYKVAWIHFDQSAILAVHSHVITRNPRITVSHENHRTWNLIINDVKEEDGGRYMCQINTATAKTQFGYLHVVVPPDIEDSASSSDVIVREGSNVSLTCMANGSPEPTIRWRRDDGKLININKSLSLPEVEGTMLEMSRISRLDMGAYLCIASNGVPPSVSKRIQVKVDFPPMLWIPHQLISSPVGGNVTLECFTEAHPNSLNYWTREDGQMIHHDPRKYRIASYPLELPYKVQMTLTIAHLRPHDFGTYKCVAKNPRGETDGIIRLYASALMTTTPHSPQEETIEKVTPVANKTGNAISKPEKDVKTHTKLNTIEKFMKKENEGGSKTHHVTKKVTGCGVGSETSVILILVSFTFLKLLPSLVQPEYT